MNEEAGFTRAMQEHPEDTSLRLVFADWLEEQGDARAELIRLLHTLTQSVEVPDRRRLEDRLRSLMAAGVKPIGPFWTNSIGMKFAWVPAGSFLMGSPETEKVRGGCETQFKVTLRKGFFLTIYPVTQAYWREVMGNNPSHFQGDDLPVEHVSWEDSQAFLQKLSEREGHSFRLPTDAEWEFACRAGTTTPFYFGETISADQGLFDYRRPYGNGTKGVMSKKTTSVGSFPANSFGLYDMPGNVQEWCADWHEYYPGKYTVDPQGPPEGDRRVLRGGSFQGDASFLRSAHRYGLVPTYRFMDVGFRAAMTFPLVPFTALPPKGRQSND
jgi:uncharacterized protein (TIGR02996 family)